jgi:ankyrin repeat protein
VPYPSLSYCSYWANEVDVTVDELEEAEHREILKDKTFTRLVVEYVCLAPPPPQLPDSFKELRYEVTEIRDRKKAQRALVLTHKGIQVLNKSNSTLFHKKYSTVRKVESHSNQTFTLDFGRASYLFHSPKNSQICQEINVRVKFIEYSRPSVDEVRDEFGQTELHRAVNDNDIALVRELLSDDRDINAQDINDWSPLHCAAYKGHIDIALLLLRHPKIDTTLLTKDKTTAFHYMIRVSGEDTDPLEEVWEAFLGAGIDVNVRGRANETPLHEAVARRSMRGIAWLIKQFANINARNRRGETPLHYAVQQNDRAIITFLLENGADRHIQNSDGQTAIGVAQKISPDLLTFVRGSFSLI